MDWEELYHEHLKTFVEEKKDGVSDEEVENAFDVLLNVLPNDGKLYKYRSFEPSNYDKYYSALKDGYLWFPNAEHLNDDLDTVIRFDPVTEAENIRNYLMANPELYFKALFKHCLDSATIDANQIDHVFRGVIDCYNVKTGKMDRAKARKLLQKKGFSATGAIRYLDTIDSRVKGFVLKNKKALAEVVDNFVNANISLRRNSLIYSMSETYQSNPMWALYANNNKGFCIEYDFQKAKAFDTIKKRILLNTYQVIYNDTVEEYSFVDIIKYFLTGKEDTELCEKANASIFKQLMTKQTDWSFEKEWRILLMNLSDNRIYLDLVSRIIIDERALGSDEADRLIRLCRERNWDVLIRTIQYINVAHKYLPFSEWEQRRQKNARS